MSRPRRRASSGWVRVVDHPLHRQDDDGSSDPCRPSEEKALGRRSAHLRHLGEQPAHVLVDSGQLRDARSTLADLHVSRGLWAAAGPQPRISSGTELVQVFQRELPDQLADRLARRMFRSAVSCWTPRPRPVREIATTRARLERLAINRAEWLGEKTAQRFAAMDIISSCSTTKTDRDRLIGVGWAHRGPGHRRDRGPRALRHSLLTPGSSSVRGVGLAFESTTTRPWKSFR